MMNERSYKNEVLENILQEALTAVNIPEESQEIINAYYETNIRGQGIFTIRIMPGSKARFEAMLHQMSEADIDCFVLCYIPDDMLELDWLLQNYGYHIASIAEAGGLFRIDKEGLFIANF